MALQSYRTRINDKPERPSPQGDVPVFWLRQGRRSIKSSSALSALEDKPSLACSVLRSARRFGAAGTVACIRRFGDFPVIDSTNFWMDIDGIRVAATRSTSSKPTPRSINAASLWRPIPATCSRSYLRLRDYSLRRRAMGASLDHYRHVSCRTRPRPRAHHGRAVSVLPLADSPEGPSEGGRGQRAGLRREADARQRPPRLRLRACATHHAEVNRQQR